MNTCAKESIFKRYFAVPNADIIELLLYLLIDIILMSKGKTQSIWKQTDGECEE